MTQLQPPTMPGPFAPRPHRGVLILIFGILGLFFCVIFGIAAWIMGNTDLKEMEAGRMDPSGIGLTQAGRILGMIAVALLAVGLVFFLIFVVFAAIMAIAAP